MGCWGTGILENDDVLDERHRLQTLAEHTYKITFTSESLIPPQQLNAHEEILLKNSIKSVCSLHAYASLVLQVGGHMSKKMLDAFLTACKFENDYFEKGEWFDADGDAKREKAMVEFGQKIENYYAKQEENRKIEEAKQKEEAARQVVQQNMLAQLPSRNSKISSSAVELVIIDFSTPQ